MKIVIPMTGIGNRFVQAGYKTLKPLIKIHEKTMIEWVIRLFPNESDFIFICREDHLKTTNLKAILKKAAPTGKLLAIDCHKKGPVYAVKQVYDHIPDNEAVIVNYCDYFMNWDYLDFKAHIEQHNPAGSIVCYQGFHPHLLYPENVYAGCLTDDRGYLTQIKEKHSFTIDKTKSLHSAGLYYFQSGQLMKQSFDWLMQEDLDINGEYYVSMVYDYLLEKKLPVSVYNNVPHFCQWGTPQDLEEYCYWNV